MTNVLEVVCLVVRVNKNVIQVDNNTNVQQRIKNVITLCIIVEKAAGAFVNPKGTTLNS